MKPRLFISYSRRQTPFVDSLVASLERSGYLTWLDYHSLVPAKPWYDQIVSGVKDSGVFLLVVSKDSIKSKNVEPEWRLALELKKRIVLLIFEAVSIPVELQNKEWVDFRINSRRTYELLIRLLDNETSNITSTPPQRGFRAPIIYWISLILSVLVAIGSFPAWWTIIIPYILIPLPWQIYKRNYVLSRIIPALLLIPLFNFFGIDIFTGNGILGDLGNLYKYIGDPVVLAGWLLLGLLITPIMQTRGRPEAAQLRFRNRLAVDVKKQRSVVFDVEYAFEDGRYAEELRRSLEKHGHRSAREGDESEVVFALISTYNFHSKYDPDIRVVIPVILQNVKSMDLNLQRIQWIDFRKGIKHTDKLAALLPEPEKLLKALSIPPAGSQELFPLAVNVLQYFFLLTSSLAAGGFFLSILTLGALLFRGDFGLNQIVGMTLSLFYGLISLGFISSSLNGLRTRRGGVTSVYPLVITIIYQPITLFFLLGATGLSWNDTASDLFFRASYVSFGTLVIFPVALIISLLILLFRWKELYRWLPRQQTNIANRFERMFLLYSPSPKNLGYHVIFHISLFIALLFFGLLIGSEDPFSFFDLFCFCIPLILILGGTYWQVKRT